MTRATRRPIVRAIIVSSLVLVGLAAAPRVAQAQTPPETIEYYATDALGSVRVVFTPTGQVIGRSDYLPFGDTQEQSGMLPRQRFTGQEPDGVAGLDDFNARSLQMRTGRMSSPDPLFGNALVNPQRWNRYAYALNNPLRYTDPTGMDAYDNDASVRAANAFAQEFWGLQAWDDFSREPWAIAWGYSYGPFSPRELYNAAFTPRDNGGGGGEGLLPSKPWSQLPFGVPVIQTTTHDPVLVALKGNTPGGLKQGLCTLWKNAGFGFWPDERSANIFPNPHVGFHFAFTPNDTREKGTTTIPLLPGSIALAHTHPNLFSPIPTDPEDYDAAKKRALLTVSRGAIYYTPQGCTGPQCTVLAVSNWTSAYRCEQWW